jgi:transcription elongation GreA/GreB family factor
MSIRRFFIQQLRDRLLQTAASAGRAEHDAREAARTVATESEKKEDARVAIEFGCLAKGHRQRALAAREQAEALDTLLARVDRPPSRVQLGAIVDVATEDDRGSWERTFIVLPVGAATELEGPGGDGFVTVITPASPVGRALMGHGAGDVVDVTIRREPFEWEILSVA